MCGLTVTCIQLKRRTKDPLDADVVLFLCVQVLRRVRSVHWHCSLCVTVGVLRAKRKFETSGGG